MQRNILLGVLVDWTALSCWALAIWAVKQSRPRKMVRMFWDLDLMSMLCVEGDRQLVEG